MIRTHSNGAIRKDNETVKCKYRGSSIECPKADFRADMCDRCGWNPLVEMHRIDNAKKQLMKRRPSKKQIFTKGLE